MSSSHRHECRVYVANLPPDVRTKDVEDLFRTYGQISHVDLKNHRKGAANAFIEFADSREAEEAVHSRDGYDYNGYTLRVEFPRGKDYTAGDSRSCNGNGGASGAERLGPTTRSRTRATVSRLTDAKNHIREAGDVCHASASKNGTAGAHHKDRKKSDDTRSHEQYISSLVLWRRPLNTIYYATHELIHQLISLTKWVLCHTRTCSSLVILFIAIIGVSYIDGPHQHFLRIFQNQALWCLYWCGLGILSSVGLGTGLHTFLLYLGPHIASVTLAAYECDSLDFPSPPYPDEIICPVPTPGVAPILSAVSVWTIMSKVRLEAFMWGAGTALGELPPYFVARAHRLSGEDEEELDQDIADEITGSSGAVVPNAGNRRSMAQRFRANMIHLVTKVGFFGILACASIPNPLFDLAGITCGYSLVPFWTFFGATLIGKAVIKMHIQKLFVIVAFNENYVDLFVDKSRNIPYVGQYLHEPLREFLVKQKANLHKGSAKHTIKESSWLSTIFEWVVISMLVYFVVSIVNSMAQSYQKRQLKAQSGLESGEHSSNHLKTK